MHRLAVLFALLAPSPALAQITIAHDTLSPSTPVAVTCGFCAEEAFGVVFRELPIGRGVNPGDFPLELRGIEVAMASARTTGSPGAYVCQGTLMDGTIHAEVWIYAGVTMPTGPIGSIPVRDPWSTGETLVWASDDVPIEPSRPDVEGSAMFMLGLNTFDLTNEFGETIVVDAPNTYLRVVVVIPEGGGSTLCTGASMMPPAGVPMRDDDGRIAPERSFIYAAGTGFLWNEMAGVNGDWAIRVSIVPSTAMSPDGGRRDAGPRDAGRRDAGPAMADTGATSDLDAGPDAGPPAPGGGCSCRTAPRSRSWLGAALGLVVLAAARRRRA
jgi:MYXO-CTERM domain-containing protein